MTKKTVKGPAKPGEQCKGTWLGHRGCCCPRDDPGLRGRRNPIREPQEEQAPELGPQQTPGNPPQALTHMTTFEDLEPPR